MVHGGKSFPESMQLEPLAHELGRAALTDPHGLWHRNEIDGLIPITYS
jgi:hypothetical protein